MTTKAEMRDVLRVYRRGPDGDWQAMPAPTPTVTPTRDTRQAVTVAAFVLLAALAVGSVVYGAATFQTRPASALLTVPVSVNVWGYGRAYTVHSEHPLIYEGQGRRWLQPLEAEDWTAFRARGCAACHDSVTILNWRPR